MAEDAQWFENHRSALLEDVSRATSAFMKDVTEESARREKALSDQITKLVIQSAHVEALENENKLLKAQLATALGHQGSGISPSSRLSRSSEPASSSRTDVTVPTQAATVPFRDYAELTTKYNDLKNEYQATNKAYEILLDKYHGAKKNVKLWIQYLERHKAKTGRQKGDGSVETPVHQQTRESNALVTPVTTLRAEASRYGIPEQAPSPATPPELSPTIDPMDLVTAPERLHLDNQDEPDPLPQLPPLPREGGSQIQCSLDARASGLTRESSGIQEVPKAQREASRTSYLNRSFVGGNNSPKRSAQTGPSKSAIEMYPPTTSNQLTSSQTTRDEEHDADQPIHTSKRTNDDEDDIPTVVTARPVKRKRPALGNGDQTANRARSADAEPVRIKDEPVSPVRPKPPAHYARTHTLDLDATQHRIVTPRKRRRQEDMLKSFPQSSFQDSLRHERSTSVPLQESSHDDEEANQDKNSPSHHQHISKDAHDDPQIKVEETARDEQFRPIKPRSYGRTAAQVLPSPPQSRPRSFISGQSDTNVSLAQTRTRQIPWPEQSRSRRSMEGRGSVAISNGSENGEETSRVTRSPPRAIGRSKNRLLSLLEGDPSQPQPLTGVLTPTPSTRSSRILHGANSAQVSPETKPNINIESIFRSSAKSTPATSSKSHRSGRPQSRRVSAETRSPQPKKEPLRARSLSRLSREDFVVNPAYNKGIDFAFKETVRKMDERRCLPGCVRPECCGGHFRRLVELSGLKPTIERGIWDPPAPEDSSEEYEEEERVLKWFLGGAYSRQKTESMTSSERKETLIQARTKLLADRSGKHKQTYQRRKTPPLYWETDMPSTQEFEAQRRLVDEDERKEVEKRWLDAMREGGSWKFRDE